MRILKYSDLRDVPWKNGGGITRNIAKGVLPDGVAWTISRADVVQDGAFSDFSGMERILTVVSGGTMRLECPDRTFEATPWTPVRFDGGLPISSRLQDGPLTDLNLMYDPTHCAGDVQVLRGPVEKDVSCPAGGLVVYHVLAGAPVVDATALEVGDSVFVDPSDQALTLNNGDAALEIRLTYPDQSDAIKLCIAER